MTVVRRLTESARRSSLATSLACAVSIGGGGPDQTLGATTGCAVPTAERRATCLVDPGARAQIVDPRTGGTDDVNTAHGDSSSEATPEERGVEAAMFGRADDVHARHLRHTPTRAPSRADSLRAWALVREMRSALARFADERAARRAGYRPFAPDAPGQTVLHYTHVGRAWREGFRFDPAQPGSLLYTRGADGSLTLVGAMYGASERADPADLDARVPLSIARWHLHVNLCVPPMHRLARWRETRDGRPLFGPLSPIASRAECSAVGGRFRESVFGWMVHVNAFAGGDLDEIFGHVGAAGGMVHGGH